MTFEKILLESIDDGLDCLGEKGKLALYLHLNNKYLLSKQDIPDRVESFTQAIEDIFQTGAKLLEIKIMKMLFAKTGQDHVMDEPENLNFLSYVYALRKKVQASCYPLHFANHKKLLCTCVFCH